jgi:hypothetical protein
MSKVLYITGGLLIAGGIGYYLYSSGYLATAGSGAAPDSGYRIKRTFGTSYSGITIAVPTVSGLEKGKVAKFYGRDGNTVQAKGEILDVRQKSQTDGDFAAVRVDISRTAADRSTYFKVE